MTRGRRAGGKERKREREKEGKRERGKEGKERRWREGAAIRRGDMRQLLEEVREARWYGWVGKSAENGRRIGKRRGTE